MSSLICSQHFVIHCFSLSLLLSLQDVDLVCCAITFSKFVFREGVLLPVIRKEFSWVF